MIGPSRKACNMYLAGVVMCMVILVGGITAAFAGVLTIAPSITRSQRVAIELDPNDSGTALYHCHSHAITGAHHNTFVFTHCKHGLR